MPIEVNLAKLSPTMESGQMVKWMVKVGDQVKEGDTLAEIQTDKAVMPMEAFDEGTVAVLDVKEGDEIALGQRVLLLAKKGEDPNQVAAQAKAKAGATAVIADDAIVVGEVLVEVAPLRNLPLELDVAQGSAGGGLTMGSPSPIDQ